MEQDGRDKMFHQNVEIARFEEELQQMVLTND